MITTAWSMAIWIAINGVWQPPVIKPQVDAKYCLNTARSEWAAYWSRGNENDNNMRVKCYRLDGKTQYWVRCTKYGSCTVKG